MDISNDKSAAPAAREDVFLSLARAAGLLEQGRQLKAARRKGANRYGKPNEPWLDCLRHMDISADFADDLIALVDAGATPGVIAYSGVCRAIAAAQIGLTLSPASEIVVLRSGFEGADLMEMMVPPRSADGPVMYFSSTTLDGEPIIHSSHRLREPIHIGLTSIEASRNPLPGWGQCDKDESDRPFLQRIRAEIARMQAAGIAFEGGAA